MKKTGITKQEYTVYILLLMLMFIALIWGIYHLGQPMIADGDAYARAIIAKKTPALSSLLFVNTTWAHLYFSLQSLAFLVYDNMQVTPRAVTLAFSIFSIPFMYYFAFSISKNRVVALLASGIFTFLPMRTILATHTLSEPLFLFFLLFSLILLMHKKYFFSFLLFNIAQGIRFEGWFFVPFIVSVVWVNERSWKKTVSYLVFALAYPIYLSLRDLLVFKDPLYFLSMQYKHAQEVQLPEFYDLMGTLNYWIKSWFEVYPVHLSVLSILGVYKILKAKNNTSYTLRLIAILPVYLFFSLVFQMYIGSLNYAYRYLFTAVSLSVPFCALGFVELIHFVHRRSLSFAKGVLFITVVIVFLTYSQYYHRNKSIFTNNSDQAYKSILDVAKHYLAYQPAQSEITVNYYYKEERHWTTDAFYYFSNNTFNTAESKYSLISNQTYLEYRYLVVEKDGADDLVRNRFAVVYENDDYLLLKNIF